MLSKEEIEKAKQSFKEETDNEIKVYSLVNDYTQSKTDNHKIILEYIQELERENKTLIHTNKSYKGIINKQNIDKQKLIEKLEERIKSVEKCYQDLIKSYYDEKLNIINTSSMSKKEKIEFINKKNCLLVQKHCYEEILKILKGENDEV